ncbi:hypothetical protein [Kitasatospora aureofaciens]|uniref:hypothetical protein n=1 Tax=Kitasatospora aureofaciens TaxID=1894 RepID=UPI000527B02B|nr:hypothetical protein [Kitasatospora aureofaciens]HJD83063.1 hypothetical protein [Kitasatospora aureofaciens]
MSAAAVSVLTSSVLTTSVSMASAAQAARELRLVEIGFVLLLAGCAAGALVLLRSCGRKR